MLLPGPLRRFIERTITDLWNSRPRGQAPVFARPEPEMRPVRSCKLKKINYRGSNQVDALLREEVLSLRSRSIPLLFLSLNAAYPHAYNFLVVRHPLSRCAPLAGHRG